MFSCVICGPQTPAYLLLLLLPFVPLQEVIAHWIAESRIAIEEIRLLTLKTAHSIDTLGSAGARKEVRTFGPPCHTFLPHFGHSRFHGDWRALRILEASI